MMTVYRTETIPTISNEEVMIDFYEGGAAKIRITEQDGSSCHVMLDLRDQLDIATQIQRHFTDLSLTKPPAGEGE